MVCHIKRKVRIRSSFFFTRVHQILISSFLKLKIILFLLPLLYDHFFTFYFFRILTCLPLFCDVSLEFTSLNNLYFIFFAQILAHSEFRSSIVKISGYTRISKNTSSISLSKESALCLFLSEGFVERFLICQKICKSSYQRTLTRTLRTNNCHTQS